MLCDTGPGQPGAFISQIRSNNSTGMRGTSFRSTNKMRSDKRQHNLPSTYSMLSAGACAFSFCAIVASLLSSAHRLISVSRRISSLSSSVVKYLKAVFFWHRSRSSVTARMSSSSFRLMNSKTAPLSVTYLAYAAL